jgi:hypothetical protein
MAESPLFNSFVNNLPNKLFNQKKSTPQPYYDDEYLAEQEGLRKHYDEGGAGPTSPDPDQIHYEEIQERSRFNNWLSLDSIAKIESNNTAGARSPSGALGWFQIKPHVAKDPGYGIKPLVTVDGTYTEEDILNSPREWQEDFVYSYLTQARAIFKGDKAKTLLSYMSGIPAMKQIESGKRKLNSDDIRYLEKYMKNEDLTRAEIFKAFPQLKNNEKFKREE